MRKKITTIDENARASLGISRDEFALCDYVQFRSADPRSKARGYCTDSREEEAEFIGITVRGLIKMIGKMERIGLLERSKKGALSVTATWIDAVNGVKKQENSGAEIREQDAQSTSKDANKVHSEGEQSSLQTGTKFTSQVNKVHPTPIYKYDKYEEVGVEEEQRETQTEKTTTTTASGNISFSVEENPLSKEVAPPPAPEPPAAAPAFISPLDSPNVHTAHELRAAMSRYYNQNPSFFKDGILDMCKGALYTKEQMTQIVTDWCLYAIEKGAGSKTYSALNADLGKWVKNQPEADRWKAEKAKSHAKTTDTIYTPPPVGTKPAPVYVPR